MSVKNPKNKKKQSKNNLLASDEISHIVKKPWWKNFTIVGFALTVFSVILTIIFYILPPPLHPEVKIGMKEVSEIRQFQEQNIDKLIGFDKGDKEKLKKVVQLQKEGKLHEAFGMLNEIENKYLTNVGTVYFLKGNNYIIIENYLKAIDEYNKATTINADFADAWYNKSIALFKLGRYEEVITCCDRAISINPKASYVWNQKGAALGRLGRYEEAIECSDKAIAIKPNVAEAWYNKGVTLFILGRNCEALACYDVAITNKPDFARAWGTKSYTLFILGRYKEAFETIIQFFYRNTAA